MCFELQAVRERDFPFQIVCENGHYFDTTRQLQLSLGLMLRVFSFA